MSHDSTRTRTSRTRKEKEEEKPPPCKKVCRMRLPSAQHLQHCGPHEEIAKQMKRAREKEACSQEAETKKLKSERRIQIFAKIAMGEYVPLEVCLDDPIQRVIQMVNKANGYASCKQLALKKKLLSGHCTVADYNIQRYDVLQCAQSLKNGYCYQRG